MIDEKTLKKMQKKIECDPANKIRHRMLNKVALVDLITDADTELDLKCNIEINTHGVTDQKSTDRCWAFAGLNILREKVIEKCKLDNFELSASYIAFYDKLERFNVFLDKLILYKKENRDLYDRDLASLLESGIWDGGYFTQLALLINKYGIVPKNIFPESFADSNTYEINQILSRLLRKFYIDLENIDDMDNLKEKYLESVYLILTSLYGVPVDKFDFEYTDKDGIYYIDKDLTPKEFYHKYFGGEDLVDDYIEITCYQDDKVKYNNLYELDDSMRVSGTKNNLSLNIEPIEFNNLIIKALKNNNPVYFYCSTTFKRIDGIWIDTMQRYGDIFGVDLVLDKNSILKTNGVTNCHCMLITGVNIVDDKITKWKIQNSWGSMYGKNGYYVATDDWVNKYVHRIVINKKFLDEKHLALLEKDAIKMGKWDEKF